MRGGRERGVEEWKSEGSCKNGLISALCSSPSFLSLSLSLSLSLRLVKIWDYQNKACVQTLEGHAQNVTAVTFHSELPILLTGSEDGEQGRGRGGVAKKGVIPACT